MSTTQVRTRRLLIAGLTPTLLEKSALWFEKEEREILRARHTNPFWKHKTAVIEEGAAAKLSELLRTLHDLGYATVTTLEHPGELTYRGDAITIFPINTRHPWRIDFVGNSIEAIEAVSKLASEEESQEAKKILKEANLSWLRPGDFVVHADHGIGIFRGIEEQAGRAYLVLGYAAPAAKNAEPDRLLVPEELAKKVTPYIGFRTPHVHRLGTPFWNTLKRHAKEDAAKLASELLKLYAERALVERTSYAPHPEWEDELAAAFAHEETPDQTKAIAEVFSDMEKTEPMDRLLLADVGFGKTEIAIRAAFRAAINGCQVALICPTTVLADQHFRTFAERLTEFPVTLARLSRLESAKDQRETIKKIADGKVDIVIATHRALSRDVHFRNLGLVILDEEQRFGVKQKEHVKHIQRGVDVLSLSATPIPRTLNAALSKLREMSVITTPPASRIAPKTFVLPFGTVVVKEAIQNELSRGGQVYFLSNHIRKIPLAVEFIKGIIPRARLSSLHGRMSESEIVPVMRKFREHEADILVSTTIIENGLDISNANTLIVEDASRIGLAQAHQLRGRIGRGAVQAYAYFLYPARKLQEKAASRLDALFRTQYLGAGQDIALRDLEIRGAGNLLGRDQSGRINQIGLNLYCQMLAEAVEELRR